MKMFSAAQIKEWDAVTIAAEPIASIHLMERAAAKCADWILFHFNQAEHFHIFCGKGNNGGDGLAIARMLLQKGYTVTTYILEFGRKGTEDFQANLERLHDSTADIHFLQSQEFFPIITGNNAVIIDALFGTGLNQPLNGISAAMVEHINNQSQPVVAIDMPSGLYADQSSKGNTVIHAAHTLSFQCYKLAFVLPENASYTGQVNILNIGLDKTFESVTDSIFKYVDLSTVRQLYQPRLPFAHKGTYGHAALFTGSYGMMGAAVLSTLACLRSGTGKVTSYIPSCGYNILQSTVPEAMCMVCGDDHIQFTGELQQYNSVGIGPGLGRYISHKDLLKHIFTQWQKPIVVDADALNEMADEPSLMQQIPPGSMITPHPKEFERLFGASSNDFERIELALKHAKALQIYIVLKGHYTFIATPNGKGYFNSTGNTGMATAGSGDVLTGILTGLLAQGYAAEAACILGVFLHGLAGDAAARSLSQEAMIAGDIIKYTGTAFQTLQD